MLRYFVGAVCAYEAVSCFSRRLPTISEFVCSRGRKGDVVGGLVVGGLAVHFLWSDT